MRKTEQRQIGDNTYIVNQLGAIEGRRVLARLMQLFGGMVAGMVAAEGKTDMVAGFVSLARGINPETMDYFCDVFTPWTQVRSQDGKTRILKDCFDDHFVANYDEMINWLGFCLEVNFASFLGGSSGIAGLFGLGGKEPSPSESPKVSIGPSGAS